MTKLFNEIYKGYSAGSTIKTLVLAVLLALGALYGVFELSRDGNTTLFILVTLALGFITYICLKKVFSYKMSFGNLFGNIITAGLILYFGLFIVLKVFPDLKVDTLVTNTVKVAKSA